MEDEKDPDFSQKSGRKHSRASAYSNRQGSLGTRKDSFGARNDKVPHYNAGIQSSQRSGESVDIHTAFRQDRRPTNQRTVSMDQIRESAVKIGSQEDAGSAKKGPLIEMSDSRAKDNSQMHSS